MTAGFEVADEHGEPFAHTFFCKPSRL
jgi:hypothetical protein